jgi:hypothetical protein
MNAGIALLSEVRSPTLTLICEPCKRMDIYSAARLWARHGDASLPDLRAFLSADCPKRASLPIYDRCQAQFEAISPPTPRRSASPRSFAV